MVAARNLEQNPFTAAEDLRKHVIHLLQTNGEETKGNILVLPQVFLEFLDYDHKMAIFLNKLLYWTERTKNPDRWIYRTYDGWFQELGFKESVIRRLLYGDPRAKTRKRTLTDLGVEVKVRRAPNGSPTCFYRLRLDIFLDAIHHFLAEKQGLTATSESVQCVGSNLCITQDQPCASQGVEILQCMKTSDQETTTQIPPEGNTSRSSCAITREDDLDLEIFFSFESRFGKLKDRFHEPFRSELARLGATKVGEVLDRCATRGRSWVYVQHALANEQAVTRPQTDVSTNWSTAVYTGQEDEQSPVLQPQEVAPVLFIGEGVQTPWPGFGKPGATVLNAWMAAFHQLEFQLDRASFETWLRGATLVDFDPESQTFVIVVRTTYARDFLQGRLDRLVKRILGDVYGQPAAAQFLTAQDWRLREGKGGENAAIA
jgi:hypothetical protein